MLNGDTILVNKDSERQTVITQSVFFDAVRQSTVDELKCQNQRQSKALHLLDIYNRESKSMSEPNDRHTLGQTRQRSPMEFTTLSETGNPVLLIHKDNQQRQLELPTGWKECEKQSMAGCLYAELKPADSSESRLVYWNRGYGGNKLSRESAAAFKNILNKPPHILNDEETKQVRAVLSNGIMKNDGFFEIMPSGLRTEALADGSNALILDARWPDSGKRSYGVFADFDGSGKYVEQAYIIASENEFNTRLKQTRAALHSLKWK